MAPNFDLNLRLHNYRPHDDIKRGLLELVCEGSDCNEQFINAIGRIAVERLAMYAFAEKLIKIERINPDSGYHDSIPFNHDMMRLRLKNMPVMNIDPGFAILHERFWKNVDYRDQNRPIHENEKRIEVFIDAKNTAPEVDNTILHVTTNDIKMFVDDKLVEPYSKTYPLLLISLKPKEAFKCSMKAVLGVGVVDTCWDACSNFCYDMETIPGSLIAKFQSASQFDEFVLINRALEYFRSRTKLLKEEVHRMYLEEKEHTDRFQIVINDETHTLGEAINYELQSHPNIDKSSVSKPNHLIRQIVLDVYAEDKSKMLNAVLESFDNLVTKIDKFETEFGKISKSAIKTTSSAKVTSSKATKTTEAETKTKSKAKLKRATKSKSNTK